MKEFKCEYKTPIRHIKKCPNEYIDLLGKFKEMKRLVNRKIYSQIKENTTRFTFRYNRVWILDAIGNILIRSHNDIYYKSLRYNAIYYTDIPFRALRNKYLRYIRPISQYKRRIE